MVRRILKYFAILLGVLIVAIGAAWLFLPQRFSVNIPWRYLLGWGVEPPAEGTLRVPEGFSISRYATGLEAPRLLRFTPAGDLLVTTPRAGRVMLLAADRNSDGRPDGVRAILEGLNRPHGVDLHEGWLYVAESDAVGRARFDAERGTVTGPFERIVTGLPGGGNHWTRTLRFGPDGWMYLSIGSSCNACVEEDPRRAVLLRFKPDGSGQETYATGLRNAVGFDWHPDSAELYATDNGRDLLGDDFPPEELNRVVQGGFYGWPFANGDRIADPDLGAGHESEVAASIPPVHGFRAHNAALGITFVRGSHVPEVYQRAALVALHGSWNRSRKDGYKVVSLHWSADGKISERDFLTGFLKDDTVFGRPVDVAEGPDGAFYVTDDYAGAVYRIAHGTGGSGSRTVGGGLSGVHSPALEGLPPAEVEARAHRGAELYRRAKCATCHESVTGPRLAGLAARYTVTTLGAYLQTPTPPMPVYPMTDEERRDLSVYLLTSAETR